MIAHRYRPFPAIDLPDRQWPARTVAAAPRWCSVDLRDGNQALIEPMDVARKRRFFSLLVALGFREIEVGFPSASATEFAFVRELIEQRLIPPDVCIGVLTPAREELIARTLEAIDGAPEAIVHVYNATSPLFRRVVFGTDVAGVTALAVSAVEQVRAGARALAPRTRVRLEYSPETFSATELPVSLRVCDAVTAAWGATPDDPVILNLPATVEVAGPNVYADQIEWMDRRLARRDAVVLSLHPHNDRGTGVAAAELGLAAGADRVEGTLFGNGERTGNVCLITLALNLATQGVDPRLDLSDIPNVVRTVEACNGIPVHPRHPYGGELVFTAFSGSHQDAIKKGFAAAERGDGAIWEMPYLPIDPRDIGRSYESVVRVNSQSGKGGIAYVLGTAYGFDLPRALQFDFARRVQRQAEADGGELEPERLHAAFESAYVCPGTLRLAAWSAADGGVAGAPCALDATISDGETGRELAGDGNGPIDAYVDALRRAFGRDVRVREYHEHALGTGADAAAVAYVAIAVDGAVSWGIAVDPNIVTASLTAITTAFDRAVREAPSPQENPHAALAV